jgi:adenosylcobyric acid synthase
MVQGASSSAGKSLLTVAIARALHRRGIDVVPFKAQNMSNNARVAGDGEMATAQYLQALAAGLEPEVRMNPVLVKPEADQRSQVVVLGRPDLELSRMSWRERQQRLWPVIEGALQSLRAEHEMMLLEGAGSPAEPNLRDIDLANARAAHAADASVLIVADIDRGGAFAHLYRTWALLAADERARIAGFVLNKFRGDPGLLAPAPEQLQELTGVPTLGVLPWLDHGLPDEDEVAVAPPAPREAMVAIVRYPTASNLDEFRLLEQVAEVRWVDRPESLQPQPQLVVMPGSKHVAGDLDWLRRTGIAEALQLWAGEGRPVLGICGGMQMLGERIDDDAGVDGTAKGLGLLPIASSFAAGKRTERTSARFAPLPEPWNALSGRVVSGYQIRHGTSAAVGEARVALPGGLGFSCRSVLGIYLHGLFEQAEILQALFGGSPSRSLEQVFERLADAVEEHIDLSPVLHATVTA